MNTSFEISEPYSQFCSTVIDLVGVKANSFCWIYMISTRIFSKHNITEPIINDALVSNLHENYSHTGVLQTFVSFSTKCMIFQLSHTSWFSYIPHRNSPALCRTISSKFPFMPQLWYRHLICKRGRTIMNMIRMKWQNVELLKRLSGQ